MRTAARSPKYDGITRSGIEALEERRAIYLRDGGQCQSCGKRVAFDAFQLAHRIANTVANRKKWGAKVIDHPLNRVVTCPCARCNDGQNIGNNRGASARLVAEIEVARRAASSGSSSRDL